MARRAAVELRPHPRCAPHGCDAVWRAIAAHRDGKARRTPAEDGSAVTGIGVRFMLSVLLANPIALILFLPSVLVLMILEREAVRPAVRQTATKLPTSYGVSLA